MAPRALRHHQRKNFFNIWNSGRSVNLPELLFHGKSCFLCRERSCGTGLRAFIKFFSAGYVLFCVPKENQKGRRCPQGMKAPVGLLSRRPVCAANAACSARQGLRYFRGAGGGGLRLPASASCLGRHSHPAGRCPNSSKANAAAIPNRCCSVYTSHSPCARMKPTNQRR